MRVRALRVFFAGLVLAAASPTLAQEADRTDEEPVIGLFTTLPILWGEAASLDEVLGGTAETHWARPVFEDGRRLQGVDFIAPEYLQDIDLLVLAQPRPLAPSENVALDEWVRAGGHVLLLADPLLTGESRFGLGDRRRPQDVALLSPILAHWGLELLFDADAPLVVASLADERVPGAPIIPTVLAGRWQAKSGALLGAACIFTHDGVLVRCELGEGSVVALGDAALLDLHEPPAGSAEALGWLLSAALPLAD